MRDALERLGGFEDAAGRADRPGRRAARALPQQARVLVRRRRERRARARLPSPRPLRRDRRRDRATCSPPSASTRCASAVKAWCREEGLSACDRRAADGLAAQPGRARGPPHGPAAGAPRHEPGRLPRRRSWPPRARPTRLLWTRAAGVAETTRDGETELLKGKREARGGAERAALPDLPRRVLPDEHRDGGAALRARRRAGRAHRPRAGARPLLRHRHDRAGAGRSTPARSGAWSSSRRRWPTRSRTPASTASTTRSSSPATCAPAMRPLLEQLRQARRGRGGPAPRRAVAEGRAAAARGRGRSGSSTCRATPPRSRRTRARWPTPATSSRRCGRSTCSRRRRTSSAWRCCAAPAA